MDKSNKPQLKRVRFNMYLSDEDLECLELLMDMSQRSRNDVIKGLALLAVKAIKSKCSFIMYTDLGKLK